MLSVSIAVYCLNHYFLFFITATAVVPAVTPVINNCVASAAVTLAVSTAGIANTILLSPFLIIQCSNDYYSKNESTYKVWHSLSSSLFIVRMETAL